MKAPDDLIRNTQHDLDRGDGRYVLTYEIAYVYHENPDLTIRKEWVMPRPGLWMDAAQNLFVVGYNHNPDPPYSEAWTVYVTDTQSGTVRIIHHSLFDSLNLTPLALANREGMIRVGNAIIKGDMGL